MEFCDPVFPAAVFPPAGELEAAPFDETPQKHTINNAKMTLLKYEDRADMSINSPSYRIDLFYL